MPHAARLLAVACALVLTGCAIAPLVQPTGVASPGSPAVSGHVSDPSQAVPSPSGSSDPATEAPATALPSAPTATPGESSLPSPAPSATPSGDDWTTLDWAAPGVVDPTPASPVPGDVLVAQVVAWQGGYVAVGCEAFDRGVKIGRVWRSPDGQRWQRTYVDGAEAPASLNAAAETCLMSVVATPSRLVALGPSGVRRWPDPKSYDSIDPDTAVWTSPDGLTWHHRPLPDGFDGLTIQGTFAAPALRGDQIVVLGRYRDGKRALIESDDAGATWRRVAVPTVDGQAVNFDDPVTTATGWLLTGTIERPASGGDGGEVDPVAWYSDDGVAWQRATIQSDPWPEGSYSERAWVGRSGLVWGAGNFGTDWMGSLTSIDGRAWTSADLPAQPFPVASDGTRILGWAWPGYVISDDGVHWRHLSETGAVDTFPDDGDALEKGVYLLGDQLALEGSSCGTEAGYCEEARELIWIATAAP